MRKVLFISVTKYNLEIEKKYFHLKEKFKGLSREFVLFVLAKGKPFHKKIWDTEFFLLPSEIFFWPIAFFFAFYLCFTKGINTVVAQSPLVEGFVGTILKKMLKKELIVEIHGDWQEGPFLAKKRRLEFLEKKFVPFLAKISFKNADKIRGVANYLIKKAKNIAPNTKYFLFPTFTNLNLFFDEKDIKFEKFILFVGALERVKGVEYLVEAFSKIEKEFPDFKLLIVGEGSQNENLGFKIKNLGLKNKVELKGKLSLEETKNIMQNCYCLVLPSLSEGLPRVVMEAMALGKPVIGSKVGGIPDLIKDGENGFLIKKGNSEELAQKIKILIEGKKLAIKMGQKGKELIQNRFSNEKYVLAYTEMINS